MPYRPFQPRRSVVTKETVAAEFTRADGSQSQHGSFSKSTGSSAQVDAEVQVVLQKMELACGCYWPDADVAGVCGECADKGDSPNVCKNHYYVCACGTPCCWKHSHPEKTGAGRLCTRCHIRAQNQARMTAITGAVGQLARFMFSRKPGDI